MNKFLIGLVSAIILGVFVWYVIYTQQQINGGRELYQQQIDSLNTKIDSIKNLRVEDKMKIDSLDKEASKYKSQLAVSKSNYKEISKKYEKIRLDLNSYSTDQSIEFFAEQVSEEAGY